MSPKTKKQVELRCGRCGELDAIPNEVAFRKGDSPGEYWVDVNPCNITCDVLHVRFNISELDGLAEECEKELRKERAADRRAK